MAELTLRLFPPLPQGYELGENLKVSRQSFKVASLEKGEKLRLSFDGETVPNGLLEKLGLILDTNVSYYPKEAERVPKKALAKELDGILSWLDMPWEVTEQSDIDSAFFNQPVWDRLFAKPSPVPLLSEWVYSEESHKYVYLPNDNSRPEGCGEDVVSNAFYTEILVNAYVSLCRDMGITPSIMLSDGKTILQCLSLTPMEGTQHAVLGEISGRLANSKLIDFDDSMFHLQFLECLKSLEKHQYENASVHRTVTAKAERVLLGYTSHTSNHTFIKRYYAHMLDNFLANQALGTGLGNPYLLSAVMSTFKRMVEDDMVIEDNQTKFIQRLSSGGFHNESEALGAIFRQCLSSGEENG